VGKIWLDNTPGIAVANSQQVAATPYRDTITPLLMGYVRPDLRQIFSLSPK
jgi:hypothetical protein